MNNVNFSPPALWVAPCPVHAHVGTFADLAQRRLPELHELLMAQIANPVPLTIFAAENTGASLLDRNALIQEHLKVLTDNHATAKMHTARILTEAGKKPKKHDFSGVYVFISKGTPFYVGITRTIYRRVQAHVRNSEHNTASLFFNMVKKDYGRNVPRREVDLKSERAVAIQKWFQEQSVAILPLACPVERYAFELYAAKALKTGFWNTFETH